MQTSVLTESLGLGRVGRREEFQKCTGNLLSMINKFIILIVEMISQVWSYVKTHPILHLNICGLPNVSYSSIM